MLESLTFQDVGPAPRLDIKFRERMNFLVGDNGLGKSFLLDAAWWALTRTWARQVILPHRPPTRPKITYSYRTQRGALHSQSVWFDREAERWPLPPGRPPIPGLVLYAQVDGGFSVWDPARNYWKKDDPERPAAYTFQPEEVWGGLPIDEPAKICNGLIADWANWQLENGDAFQQIQRVLRALSPSEVEPLVPGSLKKISVGDSRRHPTLKMPYGQEVPLIHASAGIKRVASLAYLLVWTWQEHLAAAELRGDRPAREIIFLIDEIEAHLHPEWQRRVVPSLLDVMEALVENAEVPVQILTATHSPMVLASVEARFSPDRDAIWELDLRDGEVGLEEFHWSRRGDANAWLTSSAFDLKEAKSLEAERAIGRALELLRSPEPDLSSMKSIETDLRAALSDTDRFWLRWSQWQADQPNEAAK